MHRVELLGERRTGVGADEARRQRGHRVGRERPDRDQVGAELGQPLGLLTPEGKLYVLFADHTDATAFEKTKTLAGKNVEITGETSARDGINGLTVLAVKAL